MDFQHNLKQILKSHLAPYPDIVLPAYRLLASDRISALLVSKQTQIVIEGFPRSGNTFAVLAFEDAQAKHVKIAHHLHSASQVLMGVRRKLPVLVLIREPMAAIRSLIVRHSNIDPNIALVQYIQFYTIARRVSNNVVIADFYDVTSNFGKVIKRVNEKFGRDFAIFKHTPENVNRIFQEIQTLNQLVDGGKETHVAKPSTLRQKTYQDLNISCSPSLQEEAILIYQLLQQNAH